MSITQATKRFMYQPDQALQGPWRRLPAALLVLLILSAGCGSDDQAADAAAQEDRYRIGTPIDDSTYALIIESEYGGDTLTTADFQGRIQSFVQQVPTPLDPAQLRRLRRGVAEEFIQRHLFRGEADRLGLEADPAYIDQQIDLIMLRNRLESREALEQALAAQGMTIDSLRSVLAEELPLQMVQEQMAETAAEPNSDELDAFRQEQAEEVRAQHILFQVPDATQDESVLQKAAVILDSVKAGSDFSEMARRHSEGPSAPNGGDLGFFSKQAMVEPFSDAAFALADSGDVAPEPVRTQFGYHLIRLTGRRTSALMDTTRARAMMMQERQRDAVEDGYRALRQKAVIRVNPGVIDVDLNAEETG